MTIIPLQPNYIKLGTSGFSKVRKWTQQVRPEVPKTFNILLVWWWGNGFSNNCLCNGWWGWGGWEVLCYSNVQLTNWVWYCIYIWGRACCSCIWCLWFVARGWCNSTSCYWWMSWNCNSWGWPQQESWCCYSWWWGWWAWWCWCRTVWLWCWWAWWAWLYGYWWWGWGWWRSSWWAWVDWWWGWNWYSATNCGWWWGWGKTSYWYWACWVVDICYDKDAWITATWWNCCYICNWMCVHRFTSSWTLTVN